ncbi:MAG: glycoside hydrolase [Acetobacteraceae bacterium]|nr:glycoside hydrolase [Acetobacteraceae bacterium]
MPAASPARIDRYLAPLLAGMAARHIDTPLRRAHFIAQLAHESGAFRFAEELADGRAYEGRADLGNSQPGDGPRFKGRGLIQLTGRANYAAYGAAIGRDLLADPTPLASDPALAVDVACWFWETRGLNAMADADDVTRITRRINGGLNGLADRQANLGRAKFFLAA